MSSPSQPENNPLDTRVRDLPARLRNTFYGGVGFMIYGLAWFFFGGYIYTDHSTKMYAAVGFIGMGLLYAVGGAQLMSIYRRWIFSETDELRDRAKVVTFVLGCVPIAAAFMFNVMVFWHMTIEDSFTILKVKATEPVKEELRWLLGDNYPEEQEGNIDPVSLEWEFKAEIPPNGAINRFLEGHSPVANEEEKQLFNKQLNTRVFEVEWRSDEQSFKKTLNLDWENASLASYHETSDPRSHPSCDLRVPILNNGFDPVLDYTVSFKNGYPIRWLSESSTYYFNKPTLTPPPALRIQGDDLVIRTNFIGTRWTTYCAINFPIKNLDRNPEPITGRSLTDINFADHQIHFLLFDHIRSNIHHFEIDRYRRRATFPEFLEQVNELVALDILKTEITGTVRTPWY